MTYSPVPHGMLLRRKVFVIPYGARAYRTYRGLRRVKFEGSPPHQAGRIAMVEDLRYALAAACGRSCVCRPVCLNFLSGLLARGRLKFRSDGAALFIARLCGDVHALNPASHGPPRQ